MIAIRMKAVVAALGLSVFAAPAFADAIDGNWCHNDGRHISIRGPEIVTPSGKRMEGQYSRHWFNYTVPAPEPGAGQAVQMTLLNENTVHLRLGDTGTPETWVRCQPSVSALEAAPRS